MFEDIVNKYSEKSILQQNKHVHKETSGVQLGQSKQIAIKNLSIDLPMPSAQRENSSTQSN